MKPIRSLTMEAAADDLADKLEPLLRDMYFRVNGLRFEYDVPKWETFMLATTEKLPSRLKNLGLDKEGRMEVLGLIDILDRSSQARGTAETADMLLRSTTAMFDGFGTFRKFIKLRVITPEGDDVTEEIFGSD